MAAKRAGAARRWKNKTKCTARFVSEPGREIVPVLRTERARELAVRTLKLRLVSLGPKTDDLLMLLQMLDDCRARLFSILPSLVATIFSLLPSPLSLRTLHQGIDSASDPLHPVPHHPWPGGMREAIK